MHLDFGVILIFFAAVVPWLGRRRVRLLMLAPHTTKGQRLALYASTIVFQWTAVGVILWRSRAHAIAPRQFGWAIPDLPLVSVVSLTLGALIFANQIVSLRKLSHRSGQAATAIPQLALKIFPQDNSERALFLLLSGTVAVCEEFIYRGFAQTVLQSAVAGYVAVGIVGSALLFALAHLYQGKRGLLSTFVIGLVFATVRAWTGSLAPGVVAHFVADASAGLMAPSRVRSMEGSVGSGSRHLGGV